MKSAATQAALDVEAIELFSEGHQALHDLTEELVRTRQLPVIPKICATGCRLMRTILKNIR